MLWIFAVLLQVLLIVSGIRKEQRAGLWSWSKFIFALAFGLLETATLVIPMIYVPVGSRYFVPIVVAASVVACANFVWFIIVCRRWKLPDGRTSLQAYRDEHPKQ